MSLFSVNGTRLCVETHGTGTPVLVLLHYFGGSGSEWQYVLEALGDGVPAVTIDLRGHGRSEPASAGYTVEEQADDVAAVIESLALDAYVLVGHSMSGKIAMALAARQSSGLRGPGLRGSGLRGLVLVAPSPLSPEPIPDDDRARLLRTHGQPEAAEQTADAIVAKPLPPEKRQAVIGDNLRTAPAAWEAWLRYGSREDLSERYGQIEVPALVLTGSDEQNIPPDVLRNEVTARLRHATYREVPDCGHLVPLEQPAVLARALRDFLGGTLEK
jgi:3-oxoadipate enol-lactonase